VKPSGMMPITVNGVRLIVSVRPTMDGSRPRLRSQNPWDSTITGVALTSSSGAKPRPIAGCVPNTEK